MALTYLEILKLFIIVATFEPYYKLDIISIITFIWWNIVSEKCTSIIGFLSRHIIKHEIKKNFWWALLIWDFISHTPLFGFVGYAIMMELDGHAFYEKKTITYNDGMENFNVSITTKPLILVIEVKTKHGK